MFLGEYSHTLDVKGRLTIPSRLRDDLADGLIITRGEESCLAIYPVKEWLAITERVDQLPLTNRKARSFERRLYGRAHEATLDKLGRVLIPGFLRDFAGIEDDVVLLGVNRLIEVWNPERLRQLSEREDQELDDILDEVSSRGV